MKPPTQRDVQAETRRSQLLEAALRLFAERGVENISIKDLAAEIGTAQGLIYHYYASKDDLLLAVFQRYNPLPEMKAIIESLYGLPIEDGLLQFANGLTALLEQKRHIFRLLARELLSPRSTLLDQVIPFRQELIQMMSGYFQERIEAGELKPQQPLIAIHMLVSGFLILTLLDQPLEPFVPPILETLLKGIQKE